MSVDVILFRFSSTRIGMDCVKNEFFEEVIVSSDSVHSKENGNNRDNKVNKKRINTVQIKMLLSGMDGRSEAISKGKTKTDEKTIKLLSEWNELTKELNYLGPPHHTSEEWRRIWSKMKYNKKKTTSTTVLGSSKDNKKNRCKFPIVFVVFQ